MAKPWNSVASRLLARLFLLVEPLPLDATERIRLHQFSVFLLTGIPTMVAFGIYHLLRGNSLMGGLTIALAAVLGVSRLMLKRSALGPVLYRINTILFAALLLYIFAIGGSGGSKALWMFTFPLIVCFLLGRWEGLAWTSALFVCTLGLVSGVGPGLHVYPYEREFTTRFCMTYWIIAAIGYWFEYLRQHYRSGMEAEQKRLLQEQARLQAEMASRLNAEKEREALILELQEAMSKVKQLRGLLPICSSCKKIRDDRGQWVQVESFVRERSEAQFSHSICPDCGEQMYPGHYKRS